MTSSRGKTHILGTREGFRNGRVRIESLASLTAEGVPALALRTVGDHYLDWHHTKADTLDKVEPDNLRRAIALLAAMSFALADMEGTLPQVASK